MARLRDAAVRVFRHTAHAQRMAALLKLHYDVMQSGELRDWAVSPDRTFPTPLPFPLPPCTLSPCADDTSPEA